MIPTSRRKIWLALALVALGVYLNSHLGLGCIDGDTGSNSCVSTSTPASP